MPNQPARDKKWVSVLLGRVTVKKVEKLAARRGVSRSEIIAAVLEAGVEGVALSEADYEDIRREMSTRRGRKKH